jgi:hypothetical protein
MAVPHPLKAVSFKLTICLVNSQVGDKAISRCSHHLTPPNMLDSIQLFQSIVN